MIIKVFLISWKVNHYILYYYIYICNPDLADNTRIYISNLYFNIILDPNFTFNDYKTLLFFIYGEFENPKNQNIDFKGLKRLLLKEFHL